MEVIKLTSAYTWEVHCLYFVLSENKSLISRRKEVSCTHRAQITIVLVTRWFFACKAAPQAFVVHPWLSQQTAHTFGCYFHPPRHYLYANGADKRLHPISNPILGQFVVQDGFCAVCVPKKVLNYHFISLYFSFRSNRSLKLILSPRRFPRSRPRLIRTVLSVHSTILLYNQRFLLATVPLKDETTKFVIHTEFWYKDF